MDKKSKIRIKLAAFLDEQNMHNSVNRVSIDFMVDEIGGFGRVLVWKGQKILSLGYDIHSDEILVLGTYVKEYR